MICFNHEPKSTCACGLNTSCPNCGQGTGAYPCKCPPVRTPDLNICITSPDFDEPMELVDSRRLRFLEILEQSLKEHADIWRELAKL